MSAIDYGRFVLDLKTRQTTSQSFISAEGVMVVVHKDQLSIDLDFADEKESNIWMTRGHLGVGEVYIDAIEGPNGAMCAFVREGFRQTLHGFVGIGCYGDVTVRMKQFLQQWLVEEFSDELQPTIEII